MSSHRDCNFRFNYNSGAAPHFKLVLVELVGGVPGIAYYDGDGGWWPMGKTPHNEDKKPVHVLGWFEFPPFGDSKDWEAV